jgi:hypothetical protein
MVFILEKIEMKVCQSCGYPLLKEEDKGTNADGKRNEEYCSMCFKDGEFIQSDITMEGMIELAAKGLSEFDSNMSYEQAKDYVSEVIPQLKRWK